MLKWANSCRRVLFSSSRPSQIELVRGTTIELLKTASARQSFPLFSRSYHSSSILEGRRTGASAFDESPRPFSKKQQKRFRQKLVMKAAKKKQADAIKRKVTGEHVDKNFHSKEVQDLISELDSR